MTEAKVIDDGGDTLLVYDVGGGLILPRIPPTAKDAKTIFENLQNYTFREDDIMLCTFPKTGRWFDYIMQFSFYPLVTIFLFLFRFFQII